MCLGTQYAVWLVIFQCVSTCFISCPPWGPRGVAHLITVFCWLRELFSWQYGKPLAVSCWQELKKGIIMEVWSKIYQRKKKSSFFLSCKKWHIHQIWPRTSSCMPEVRVSFLHKPLYYSREGRCLLSCLSTGYLDESVWLSDAKCKRLHPLMRKHRFVTIYACSS